MKHQRRRARALALQALYEVDCVGHLPGQVIGRTLEENPGLGEDGAEFLRRSVSGTLQAATTLDTWIAGCAPQWPVAELAVLDRNISPGHGGIFAEELRSALYDLEPAARPEVFGYVLGLGGRDVTPKVIEDIVHETLAAGAPAREDLWVGVQS